MPLIHIGNRDQIKTGELTRFSHSKVELVLTEHKGVVKAYQGSCPHEHANLHEGHIENGRIICPQHKWSFSCHDGLDKEHNACLKAYTVIEKNGALYLDASELGIAEQPPREQIRTMNDLRLPKGNFVVGNLLQFGADNKHQVVEAWVKECGNLFKISLLGKKFIVSADHEINEYILKNRPSKFKRFSKIKEVLDEMGIHGVFNAEGEAWGDQRKVIAEALNFKNTKGFFPILANKTNTLLKRWKKFETAHQTIDIQKEMMRYTVDITTVIAFGYDTNTLEKDNDVIQDHLEKIFPMINKRVVAPLPLWRFFKSKEDKVLDAALVEIQKTITTFIQQAKEKLQKNPALKESPSNFLEALLVQQELQGKFTDNELFGNVFTTLLAGEDTTSNSISWTLYYLTQHPDILAKIQEEADTVLGDDPLAMTYEKMTELKWTEAAANEAIRLKPVSPMLYMEALEDVVINNFKIKKGQSVILQNKVPQTSEHNFFEAERFNPERWMLKCPFTHNANTIKAFGAGPRYCPGKNLAIHEMVMAISMICKNFDISLAVDPSKIQERFAFTMFPENLILNIKQRTGVAVSK